MARRQPRTYDVSTRAGALKVHCWEPDAGITAPLTVVTVHPWAVLGGSEYNCVGICQVLAQRGFRAISFNLRSSSMVWGVLSNHSSEVRQIHDVCVWASQTFAPARIVLFGSSAGAPQAGSALDLTESVVGAVCVGYTFGWFASIGFGRHFGALLRSEKPRLMIMGDRDEFTSEATLRKQVAKAREGTICESFIFRGIGHFELESPDYDEEVARCTIEWLQNPRTGILS